MKKRIDLQVSGGACGRGRLFSMSFCAWLWVSPRVRWFCCIAALPSFSAPSDLLALRDLPVAALRKQVLPFSRQGFFHLYRVSGVSGRKNDGPHTHAEVSERSRELDPKAEVFNDAAVLALRVWSGQRWRKDPNEEAKMCSRRPKVPWWTRG